MGEELNESYSSDYSSDCLIVLNHSAKLPCFVVVFT